MRILGRVLIGNSLKDFEYPLYDKAEDALLERKELCNEHLKNNQR